MQAEIERMIIDGEFKPNERINENALSQRLGVSRGPIREACSAIAAMGLIEIIPNRGFFIRALTNDEAQDLSRRGPACSAASPCCWPSGSPTRRSPSCAASLTAHGRDRRRPATSTTTIRSIWNSTADSARWLATSGWRLIYQSFVRELHIQRYRALSSGDTLHVSNAEHTAIVDALAERTRSVRASSPPARTS